MTGTNLLSPFNFDSPTHPSAQARPGPFLPPVWWSSWNSSSNTKMKKNKNKQPKSTMQTSKGQAGADLWSNPRGPQTKASLGPAESGRKGSAPGPLVPVPLPIHPRPHPQEGRDSLAGPLHPLTAQRQLGQQSHECAWPHLFSAPPFTYHF